MVLLKPVVEVATHPVSHAFAAFGPNGSGIGVMAVGGDPIRRDAEASPVERGSDFLAADGWESERLNRIVMHGGCGSG